MSSFNTANIPSFKDNYYHFIRDTTINIDLKLIPFINTNLINNFKMNGIINIPQIYGKYLSLYNGESYDTANKFYLWLREIDPNCDIYILTGITACIGIKLDLSFPGLYTEV